MKRVPRPRMQYSVIWLLLVLGIAMNGHPMTGAFFAFPWFAHRRWEKMVRRKIVSR